MYIFYFILFGFYIMITFLELANKWNLSQIDLTLSYNLTTLEYFERHVFHDVLGINVKI